MGTIYALLDPRDHAIRYCGETSRPPTERLKRHLYETVYRRNARRHVYSWIRQLRKHGLEPEVLVLERVVGGKQHRLAAEAEWIRQLRRLGCRLTNERDVGDGFDHYHHDELTRKYISDGNRGKRRSPAQRKRLSEGAKERWSRPEERRRQSQRRRAFEARKELIA